jgi:chromatin remodeling complex protein RSC6
MENPMNLRARIYVENQKRNAQDKLESHLAMLKAKGLDSEAISQDATVRKLRGMIRKAIFRLASIAAQEKLNQERAQAKADKLAAEKAAREKPKEEEIAAAEMGKKEKKEKKEKREKPAKAQKQGKTEPKKGKEEEKGEKQENQ